MIEKISFKQVLKYTDNNSQNSNKKTSEPFSYTDKGIVSPNVSGKLLHTYLVPFRGGDSLSDRYKEFKDCMSPKALEVYNMAQKLARKYNHKEIEQIHVLKVINDMFIETIDKLDNGDLDALEGSIFGSPDIISEMYGPAIFEKKDTRQKFKTLLEKESEILDKKLEEMPKTQKRSGNLKLSKDFLNDVYNIYKMENTADDITGEVEGTGAIEDEHFFKKIIWSSNEKVKKEIVAPYRNRLAQGLMLFDEKDKVPLKIFEDKAKKIWKNLSIGTNMFILYEKGMNNQYMLDTLESVLKDKKESFGKFNYKNTEIRRYKNNIDADFLVSEIKKGMKEKNKNHVYIFDYEQVKNHEAEMNIKNVEKYMKELANSPNIKFVISANKNLFYDDILSSDDLYKNFSQISIPIINAEQAKKMLHNENNLVRNFKKTFTQKAVDKIVNAVDSFEGFYPEKAQRIMTLISNYYPEKNEITAKDVENYINEAKEIFKVQDKDETSVKVVLNTGLKLKDIIGLQTTKKEANSIIRQIKNNSIGTKGFIIYSSDGTSGSGRNYTARAIAGEAKIPFLEINAVDFGTKDVNIFGDSSTTPEAAIKKLFSMVKAQAETNNHKALVLYIQNFEYFSCGDQVSEYHEKAMSQLLKEMDFAQKQGLNIVVIGSVGNPNMIGESTVKSFKFVDKIEVESPMKNKQARKELIEYYLKKKNIRLDTKNAEDKIKLIDKFAELTEYMSLVQIMTILDKAKNVSNERKHKLIDKSDFIEALLQIECGRPSSKNYDEYSKATITSHECGHAVTNTVMNEITTSIKPWLGSSFVSYITLDPRGDFGGMVMPTDLDNKFTYTFENIFADLVMDFGGYSSEKYFYGIDGSWGITQDMENATSAATQASAIMGVGHYFGKKSIKGVAFADNKDKMLINKDVDVFLHNAQFVSDMIIEEYQDFIQWFTDEYASKVGTGECIVSGEEFRSALNDWRASLPEEKQNDLMVLNDIIKEVMADTRKGIIYK